MGRREMEEVKVRKREREKLGFLAHHSLLITWSVVAPPFNFGT